MTTKLFFRTALHDHAEPAQRALGAAGLPPSSVELARLLGADPAPEVRVAAARRCIDLAALVAAREKETDLGVRAALDAALSSVLSETHDNDGARAVLEADCCSDSIRCEVARRAHDAERRRIAISGMRDENALVETALEAGHAETRLAAAERVQTPDGLRKLADASKHKDRGVARLTRQRIDAIENRLGLNAEADAILAQLEALASKSAPITSAVVELDRRWHALALSGETARLAQYDAARRPVQERFERENEEQRQRTRFERSLVEWISALAPPAAPDGFDVLRAELAALRGEAQSRNDTAALSRLDQAQHRIELWQREREALAGVEALVIEAEQLAAGTGIDHAQLEERWHALERAIRTPALTRRFEAALLTAEQRRLTHVRDSQQAAIAARQHVHALLHTAEQALAAGQLHAARAAAVEIRTAKARAGPLPKPTTQRLGRVVQQLTELERWESFGQNNARVQLCERAEAAAAQTTDPPQLALEVQKLRSEWKALDQQHAGVPKKLWERFDRACEKAYAPAAKYFSELAARRKQTRKQREDFIAATAAHASTLLGEPRDWRAIERWMRDTDKTWREGDLGSVEPGAWKKLDTRLKTALAPLRDALSSAREQAKAERQVLIGEAAALASQAMERDVPARVKAIQTRWQEHAKGLALARNDERALWEQFHAACDAVFNARQEKRQQDDGRKHEHRRALDDVCAQLEKLALADGDAVDIRRAARELHEQWKQHGGSDPALRAVGARFKNANTAVEAMLSARVRAREAAVWNTLAAKERVCEELDASVCSGARTPEAAACAAAARERWAALPPLPPEWEQQMLARRDAALNAMTDEAAAGAHVARIEAGAEARREGLLELELLLGLDSPPEFQAQRLALQVNKLRDRFKRAPTASGDSAGERVLAWCGRPGIADASDRQRCDRIISKVAQSR